jgi:hypothetical protein
MRIFESMSEHAAAESNFCTGIAAIILRHLHSSAKQIKRYIFCNTPHFQGA